MVVVGAFPTRFCSTPVRAAISTLNLKPKPTPRSLLTGNRISSAKKLQHRVVACSTAPEPEPEAQVAEVEVEVEVEIEMVNLGDNTRKIEARVGIEAPLQVVWDVLTDYEGLADFIPGLSQSQVLQQSPNYARLFQVGEQKLGLGIKFNAKGVVDCFERDLRTIPSSGALSRDIEFRMVQGDFEVFQGIWSIVQEEESSMSSVLFYSLQVKPKIWLPVRLVESRLCNEIRINLASIRRQAIFLTYNVLS